MSHPRRAQQAYRDKKAGRPVAPLPSKGLYDIALYIGFTMPMSTFYRKYNRALSGSQADLDAFWALIDKHIEYATKVVGPLVQGEEPQKNTFLVCQTVETWRPAGQARRGAQHILAVCAEALKRDGGDAP
jgi:hypothetical protein